MNKLYKTIRILLIVNWVSVLLLKISFDSLLPYAGTAVYSSLAFASRTLWCWNIFVFPLLFLISMVGSVIHAYQQKSFCSYLLIILNLILLPTWWYISTTVFRAF